MVSVRMNVPDTRATPRTIDVAVSAVRSLRAPRPRSVSASTAQAATGASESSTIRPSVSTTVRSPIDAASSSWVTMTTFWP